MDPETTHAIDQLTDRIDALEESLDCRLQRLATRYTAQFASLERELDYKADKPPGTFF